MPSISKESKPNSGTTVWPMTLVPALTNPDFSGWPVMFGAQPFAEQTARAGLMGLEAMEAWLTASRQMIDLWRTSVREQQDAALASWRSQIVAAVTRAETEAVASEQSESPLPASCPQPGMRSARSEARAPQPA